MKRHVKKTAAQYAEKRNLNPDERSALKSAMKEVLSGEGYFVEPKEWKDERTHARTELANVLFARAARLKEAAGTPKSARSRAVREAELLRAACARLRKKLARAEKTVRELRVDNAKLFALSALSCARAAAKLRRIRRWENVRASAAACSRLAKSLKKSLKFSEQ